MRALLPYTRKCWAERAFHQEYPGLIGLIGALRAQTVEIPKTGVYHLRSNGESNHGRSFAAPVYP